MRSMLACCLNWKVLAGVGAVAAAVMVFAPGAAVAVLPLLILAICPLSMIGMMVAMRGMGGSKGDVSASPSQPELKERLAQLAAEQRQLEAQLTTEPVEGTGAKMPVDATR
ncbi:MAG: DUF2933 domain-containing protein [Tepidiformaceae bacterium]